MLCEMAVLFECLVALVALEWSFRSVFPHVSLQSARSSASVVALVTFERVFSGVLSHRVQFQFIGSNARKLACCASLWLFTRVSFLVLLQTSCLCCFIFTLIALVQIFPGVLLDVLFEVGRLGA